MFKLGDILGWSSMWNDYWKVIRLDALGFEVVRVSTVLKNNRRFPTKSKVKRYWKNSEPHSLKVITKEDVQKELNTYIESYKEFMETMP